MLAIVIPYYKLRFFKETLQSVENQTDKRFTLYIGNDASPENPEILIAETLKSVDYQYFNYQENKGGSNLAMQWERVIAETHDEEWIMVLGDDDVLEENFVEEFYNHVEKVKNFNISLIKFSQINIDENSKISGKATSAPETYSSKKFIYDRMTGAFPSSLSENIFTRSTYEKYRFKQLPLAWHSDDLAILEFSDLKDFFFIAESKVRVRISTDSISGQDNSSKEKQFATYLFCEHLLLNYSNEFPMECIDLLIKRYREIIWKNGFPLNVNMVNIYLRKKNYMKALHAFKIKYELKNRINHFSKK
ncbi:glycosyltransferase [Chryseobacterium sp. MIQD13]|uniref:glycosyltransferase n=1 Tax=Chryseobacterium sp. MIQD13 TaxID=3422310 RepID=UPI003D29DAAF